MKASKCEARLPMVVVPDPLSARTFFDCGVLDSLRERVGELIVMFTGDRYDYRPWTAQRPDIEYVWDSRLESRTMNSLAARVYRRMDHRLDQAIGWYPLAIRFNLKNRFHLERMAPGHKNRYLDLSLVGPLPQWEWLYSLMFMWVFSRTRYLEKSIAQQVKSRASILILMNLQAPRMYKYVVAARRYSVPTVAYIASWDHTVGKGVVYRNCHKYIVQNDAMKSDLMEFHGVEEGRIVVTGWPQADVFARKWTREEYARQIESYGLDQSKPVILVTGNTKTNTPYEPRFLQRFLEWLRTSDLNVSVIFRPHPKDRKWKERFCNVNMNQENFFVQPASYTDVNDLACLLQHVDCVVTHAGTILLDSLVNGRPAVCVVYDEGLDGETRYADKNVIGKHYGELMESGSFLVARSLEEVTTGVRKLLADPAMFEAERRAVADKVVGRIDGRAAERVAQAMAACHRLSG